MAIILTDLSSQPVRALPKPQSQQKSSVNGLRRKSAPKKKPKRFQKVQHNRGVPKQRDRTKITPRVTAEVLLRSDGRCELCTRSPRNTIDDRLELAHLIQRSQQGRGDIPWNIAALCGPSTQTGTCHWKIDSRRRAHRDVVGTLIARLESQYDKSEWPD